MEKVQPGHEVVSLFNFNVKPRQFNLVNLENPGALAKIITIVSAFLVVVVVSWILNLVSQNLEARTKTAIATSSEPAAFQPSQAISQEIVTGYFGR